MMMMIILLDARRVGVGVGYGEEGVKWGSTNSTSSNRLLTKIYNRFANFNHFVLKRQARAFERLLGLGLVNSGVAEKVRFGAIADREKSQWHTKKSQMDHHTTTRRRRQPTTTDGRRTEHKTHKPTIVYSHTDTIQTQEEVSLHLNTPYMYPIYKHTLTLNAPPPHHYTDTNGRSCCCQKYTCLLSALQASIFGVCFVQFVN